MPLSFTCKDKKVYEKHSSPLFSLLAVKRTQNGKDGKDGKHERTEETID